MLEIFAATPTAHCTLRKPSSDSAGSTARDCPRVGTPCLRWAQARLGDRETGVTELARALATYADQYKLYVPLYQGLLAEIQAGQEAEEALTRIDKALALASQTGERWTDALFHRIRGEILLKRDPMKIAPAEEAFLTGIAIAQQQRRGVSNCERRCR